MFTSRALAGGVFALSMVLAVPATAAEVMFAGSGVFGPTISTLLPVEVPGDTFSFSFDLPNPIASNPTTEVTNSSFLLDGAVVADPIQSVKFYDAANGGGFDLNFAFGPDLQPPVISLYLADVGSTLTIIPGAYSFTLDGVSPDAGSGTLTISAIPEPGAWAMLLVGFGALGAGLRRRREGSLVAP